MRHEWVSPQDGPSSPAPTPIEVLGEKGGSEKVHGEVVARIDGINGKVKGIDDRIMKLEVGLKQATDVSEKLRGRVKDMDERLGRAEEGCVVVEDTHERLQQVEEGYVLVSRLCEELTDRVERLDRNAREKERFDRVVTKRLHDLEVAQKEDRKQALHSHHEMERKLAELAKDIHERFSHVGANMAGIVEEMRGQGRRTEERLEWLKRHVQMTPTAKLPYREN